MAVHREEGSFVVRIELSAEFGEDYEGNEDGNAWLQCSTYPDRSPVLSITSGPIDVSVGVPDCGHVTAEDVARARQLAATVADFVADLERCVVLDGRAPDSAVQAA